jgi:hypothetical protein
MSENQTLKIEVLPPRAGMAWLSQSWTLIRAQTSRLLFLAVMLQLLLGLVQLPLLGIFIVMATPALTAGLLQAFYHVECGQGFNAGILFKPLFLRPKSGRLLLLGLVLFLVAMVAVSLTLTGVDTAIDPELRSRIEQGDFEAVKQLDPELISKMLMGILVGLSISGSLSFFSIPLIWFRDQKLMVSLIKGVQAMLLNWRAFIVLSLGLAALLVPVSIVISVLFQVSGQSGIMSFFLLGIIMLIALAFQLLIFGVQYCAFREVFNQQVEKDEPVDPDSNDHQLVA